MSAKSIPLFGLAETLSSPAPTQPGAAAPEFPAQQTLEQMCDFDLFQLAKTGETRATELLVSRYLTAFLEHAKSLCHDPTAAQDLCQIALPKAIRKLSKVTSAAAFVAWVNRFITNEMKHFSRKMKKSGTKDLLLGIDIVESSSVAAVSHYALDMNYLMEQLRLWAGPMKQSVRETALFMLWYWGEHQEFPTIGTIMRATHTPHTTAQRNEAKALCAWQENVRQSEFAPELCRSLSRLRLKRLNPNRDL